MTSGILESLGEMSPNFMSLVSNSKHFYQLYSSAYDLLWVLNVQKSKDSRVENTEALHITLPPPPPQWTCAEFFHNSFSKLPKQTVLHSTSDHSKKVLKRHAVYEMPELA